jgi:RNA polymerase sigma-70 factor (ECF subfamily)
MESLARAAGGTVSEADPGRAELQDDQLLVAVGQGDRRAFSRLYERYSAALLSICIRILRDRAEAEDVLEEVFWEVWRRRQRYDGRRARPLAYLAMLARSRAIDRLRFRKRRDPVWLAPDGVPAPMNAAASDPFEEAAAVQRRATVAEALLELPEPQRRAVELNFFEGLSHLEIARQLGQPIGTVKTRIRKGLAAMRKALSDAPALL